MHCPSYTVQPSNLLLRAYSSAKLSRSVIICSSLLLTARCRLVALYTPAWSLVSAFFTVEYLSSALLNSDLLCFAYPFKRDQCPNFFYIVCNVRP